MADYLLHLLPCLLINHASSCGFRRKCFPVQSPGESCTADLVLGDRRHRARARRWHEAGVTLPQVSTEVLELKTDGPKIPGDNLEVTIVGRVYNAGVRLW